LKQCEINRRLIKLWNNTNQRIGTARLRIIDSKANYLQYCWTVFAITYFYSCFVCTRWVLFLIKIVEHCVKSLLWWVSAPKKRKFTQS
jgi:hypothetical protein